MILALGFAVSRVAALCRNQLAVSPCNTAAKRRITSASRSSWASSNTCMALDNDNRKGRQQLTLSRHFAYPASSGEDVEFQEQIIEMWPRLKKERITQMSRDELKAEVEKRGIDFDALEESVLHLQGTNTEDKYAAPPSTENPSLTMKADVTQNNQPPVTARMGQGAAELKARIIPEDSYLLQFDGGSRGNPGRSGAGAVLIHDKDTESTSVSKADIIWCTNFFVGVRATNNEAEYMAAIAGLEAAHQLGIKKLTVQGDSKLVVKQVLGEWKVKSPNLVPLHQVASKLSREIPHIDIQHIPRAINGIADALGNEAMDHVGDPKPLDELLQQSSNVSSLLKIWTNR
jgi:ribonuclease HI